MKKITNKHIPLSERSSTIQLKLYNFQKRLKPHEQSENTQKYSFLHLHRSETLDASSSVSPEKNAQWKPKIPSKKLFDNINFLRSIGRKKTKVVQKILEANITICQSDLQSTKNQQNMGVLASEGGNRHHQSMIGNFEPIKKNPLVNHNLQYLKKQWKVEREGKKLSRDRHFTSRSHYTFIHAENLDSSKSFFETTTQQASRSSRSQAVNRHHFIKPIDKDYRFCHSRARSRKA